MTQDISGNEPQKISFQINNATKNEQLVRANYLDWLRFFIVITLIPYHTAMAFHGSTVGWINNPTSTSAALAFCEILDQFQMPLLFTIAGAATWFSLGSRTGKQYLVERLGRLFVPIIFGMLVLNAAVQYISILFHNQLLLYDNSFFIWYQSYFKTMLFPWQKDWSPGTIWFIWYLFIYSIVLLPLLIFLRKHVNNILWVKIGEFFEKHGTLLFLFLLAMLPVLIQIYPPPNVNSTFQISYFVFFFIFGFFIYSSEQMQRCIDKAGPIALVIGAIGLILVMLLIFPSPSRAFFGSVYWTIMGRNVGEDLYLMLRGVSCWFSIIGLIFLARRWGDFSNSFLRYANEAVLPFYLIHATFIITIGYYVIPLNINILSKFVIIVAISLGGTLAAFEVFKRFSLTRFFLGMRTKRKSAGQILS